MSVRIFPPFTRGDALDAITEFVVSLGDTAPMTAAIVHDIGAECDAAGEPLTVADIELVSDAVERTIIAIGESLHLALLQALSDKVNAVMASRVS